MSWGDLTDKLAETLRALSAATLKVYNVQARLHPKLDSALFDTSFALLDFDAAKAAKVAGTKSATPIAIRPERRDPLTIAYIAMGAQSTLDNAGGLTEALSDEYSGELGFIGEVISHAEMVDRLGYEAEAAGNINGVFPYEVAQPFGERYARALYDRTGEKPQDIAQALVDRISC